MPGVSLARDPSGDEVKRRNRQLGRVVTALLALATMVGLLGASPTQTPAKAAPGWPVTMTGQKGSRILTHPDRAVSVVSCTSSGPRATTYGADGATLGVVKSPWVDFCVPGNLAGYGGTLYGYYQAWANNTPGTGYMVAYRSGKMLWKAKVAIAGCRVSQNGIPYGIDSNKGTLFVVMHGGSRCEDLAEYRLFAIDTTTGKIKFQKGLNSWENEPGNVGWQAYAQLTTKSLVISTKGSGGGDFRFFDPVTGVEDTTRRYSVELARGEWITEWRANANGDLFVQLMQERSSCPRGRAVSRVLKRGYNKTTLAYPLATRCLWANTSTSTHLQVLPNGGAAFVGGRGTRVDEPGAGFLAILKPDGKVEQVDYGPPTEYTVATDYSAIQAGMGGNLALVRKVYGDNRVISGPDGDVLVDKPVETVEVLLVDSDGGRLARHVVEGYAPKDSWGRPKYSGLAMASVGLAADGLFVSTCSALSANEYCGTRKPATLHKLGFRESSPDYPRGKVLGLQHRLYLPLNMVALGDSFSSGEGVPPFEGESALNGCHRSGRAYARLLDEDPTLPIRLVAFRACSGAKTVDVIQGKNGEPGQLDALNAETDIVTISIGGNDLGFKDFIKRCFAPLVFGCNDWSGPYKDAIRKIESGTLGKSLTSKEAGKEGVYTLISRLAPNAQVYVVGYPHIVPEAIFGEDLPPYCLEFDELEKYTGRTLTARLNYAIKQAVDEMGPRFHFVHPNEPGSPFIGHELCSTGTYFVAPTLLPAEYSMHPNEKGQSAYAQLVRSVLGS